MTNCGFWPKLARLKNNSFLVARRKSGTQNGARSSGRWYSTARPVHTDMSSNQVSQGGPGQNGARTGPDNWAMTAENESGPRPPFQQPDPPAYHQTNRNCQQQQNRPQPPNHIVGEVIHQCAQRQATLGNSDRGQHSQTINDSWHNNQHWHNNSQGNNSTSDWIQQPIPTQQDNITNKIDLPRQTPDPKSSALNICPPVKPTSQNVERLRSEIEMLTRERDRGDWLIDSLLRNQSKQSRTIYNFSKANLPNSKCSESRRLPHLDYSCESSATIPVTYGFYCPIKNCNHLAMTPEIHQTHVKTHESDKVLCYICGKDFQQTGSRNRHVNDFHKNWVSEMLTAWKMEK